MSQTSKYVVCRLLGGSGRAPVGAQPLKRVPALLKPQKPLEADAVVLPRLLPLAA